jgi:nucleoside 2-deoxyribosyltransferase
MKNLKIYLAHPINGLTPDEVFDYYTKAEESFLAMGYTVFHPMTGKEHLRCEERFRAVGYDHPVTSNHAIHQRDLWMVKQADVVYCNLMNVSKVSIGCVSELTAGYIWRKHNVVAMESGSVHEHAFVLEALSVRWYSEVEAEQYLHDFNK